MFRKFISYLFCFTTLVLFSFPTDVLARAGGGGAAGAVGFASGYGKVSVIAMIILMSPYFLYAAIRTAYGLRVHKKIIEKNQSCKKFLSKLNENDPDWNINYLQQQTKTTFYRLQQAWNERNSDIAKEYMTNKLYNKIKRQTDLMSKFHEQNILEKITIKQLRVIAVKNSLDTTHDAFWITIRGSMIDYVVNDQTQRVIRGSRFISDSFHEVWKFVRVGNQWLADDIQDTIHLYSLTHEFPISS